MAKIPSTKKAMTIEDLAEMIQRNVAMKEDLKQFATKDDLKKLRDEIKDDIHDLEVKLVEDTDAITGTEQKHFRSHAQRIARLEKEVFPKSL